LKNGEELPTIEMLKKCIARTIDPENEAEMKIFEWYWEVLLPKMIGAAEWGPTVRYYNTICAAKLPPNKDGKPSKKFLITPSHEGMILAIWDNNYENWQKLWEWSQKPENKDKTQRNKGGKYTSTDKGQREFGGWEAAGIEAYNSYVDQAIAVRKSRSGKLLESLTLQRLRKSNNIDQADAQAQSKLNRSRKRKKQPNDAPEETANKFRVVRTRMLDEEDVDEDSATTDTDDV
jgi:hypothetical protein